MLLRVFEQESWGYRDSTIALAEGEADRFTQLLTEYKLAPSITRKRLYLQTMESVLARSKKVLLDVDSSGNILYLPLDGLSSGQSSAGRIPPVLPGDSGNSTADRTSPRTTNREGRR